MGVKSAEGQARLDRRARLHFSGRAIRIRQRPRIASPLHYSPPRKPPERQFIGGFRFLGRESVISNVSEPERPSRCRQCNCVPHQLGRPLETTRTRHDKAQIGTQEPAIRHDRRIAAQTLANRIRPNCLVGGKLSHRLTPLSWWARFWMSSARATKAGRASTTS